MAISKNRVTLPFAIEENFKHLTDHDNLKNIIDQVTTSKLIKASNSSKNINGLDSICLITLMGDTLTEKVVAWLPPTDTSSTESSNSNGTELGYDYKVIAGKRLIADHLGSIRITRAGENTSHIAWDKHLKVPRWTTGEIAAYFVYRAMQKEFTESIEKNMK
jgi:hypothetical protein